MTCVDLNLTLFKNVPFSTIFVSKDGRVEFFNNASKSLFPSLSISIEKNYHLTDIFSMENGEVLDIQNRESNKVYVKVKDGVDFSGLDGRIALTVDDFESGSLCVIQSINELGESLGVLRSYNVDSLTGLNNREIFKDRLDNAIRNGLRIEGTCLAVLFIDLDRFKPINDGFGHAVGDQILKVVSDRLKKCLRDSDTVARYGGDEFVALLSNLRAKEDSALVAERIVDYINREIIIGESVFSIGASVGVSIWPQDGETGERMIEAADMAMYRSKAEGGNTARFFDPGMNAEAQERATLESELRLALRERQFILYYQPQFCTKSNQIVGAEALIRWRHPVRGMVPPVHFIRVAEETNVITPIGEWVLSEAIAQAKRWFDMGLSLRVAVNLSARQFVDSLPDLVESELKRVDLRPDLIELELTESFLVADLDKAAKIIERLRAIGVRIALDDFGTGFSSLQYLRNFPVDTLKIDRSFVGQTVEMFDERMVKAILDIARNFGLDTLAEGVETQEHLDKLTRLGCDSWQGFLRSGAVDPASFVEYVKTFEASQIAVAA